jgi:hypothetical protein
MQRHSTVGLFAAVVVLVALVGAEVPYEDELRFLREKVHETWPHMPHDKAEEFALVLFKLAQDESFINLPPANKGTTKIGFLLMDYLFRFYNKWVNINHMFLN